MSGPNSAPPRAKWYVVAFHYQVALLMLLALGQLVPLAQFFQQWIIPGPWAWLGAIVFAPFMAYVAVGTILHARWLQGHRGRPEPLVGPPLRINCIMMGVLGLVLIGMAVEAVVGGQPFGLGIAVALGGAWLAFFATCGFLWTRDAVRKRSDDG